MLEKVYKKDNISAKEDILNLYKTKWFVIVNYIYFANLVINKIISLKDKKWEKSIWEYKKALDNWDFLLPDWIAFRLYYKKYFKINLQNLNWTDFLLYFLKDLNNINLIFYWAHKDTIKKAKNNIEKITNQKVFYYQNWYSDFDFDKLKSLEKNKINILCIWLWSPKQEIWCQNNLENIKKYNLIVLNQWGSFDFLWEKEKRAPKIWQKLKIEWLFRFITNPKKNFKKVIYSLYVFIYLIF